MYFTLILRSVISSSGGVIAATGGRMAPNPGGLLIGANLGEISGAVGISGDTGDNDETCARAGILAAGLLVLD